MSEQTVKKPTHEEMVLTWDVDDWVKEAAKLDSIQSFHTVAVANETGHELKAVFERLLYLTHDRRLNLHFEVKCAKQHVVVSNMALDERFNQIENAVRVQCSECNEAFNVDGSRIYPVFTFTDSFRQHMLKKKKVRVA